jgi:hypothetical protein
MDEAGISAPEPVTIVVALIVHADTQWFPVMQQMANRFATIPSQYRKGFDFHAKNVTAHNKYPEWPEPDRRYFLKCMMSLPWHFNILIAIGAVKRGANDWSEWPDKKMAQHVIDHSWAFALCMAQVARYLREHCVGEMGQVIAEHMDHKMHTLMRKVVDSMRMNPLPINMLRLLSDGNFEPLDEIMR